MDYSLPGSSVHGIVQARILEWVDISFSWARNRTRVSCISGRWLTNWAVRGVIFIVLQINLNSSVEINLQYDQFFVQYGLASLAFFGYFEYTIFSSVQFTGSVLSNTLQPHGLQHTRLPCPPPTPGACSNSCPSSWWCYLTISSSAASLSFCVQAFPASGSFPMSWLFISGDQSVRVPAKWFNFCNDTLFKVITKYWLYFPVFYILVGF